MVLLEIFCVPIYSKMQPSLRIIFLHFFIDEQLIYIILPLVGWSHLQKVASLHCFMSLVSKVNLTSSPQPKF